MDSLSALPAWPIKPSAGPISQALLAQGWVDLPTAARAIQAMPYGYNREPLTELSLLSDGCGTCVSKHALVAACALEQNWPLFKCLGIYLMNEQIVSGLREALAALGIDTVPAMHCFLSWGPYRFDLTEGNCHGKNQTLDSYIYIENTAPLPSPELVEGIYQKGLQAYLMQSGLAAQDELWHQARQICTQHLKDLLACSVRTN